MFQSYQEMLKPIIDTITSTQIPLGDHSLLQKQWNEEHSQMLYSNLSHIYENEEREKKMEKAERLLDLATDAYSMFLKEAGNPTWQTMSVEKKKEKIAHLKTVPQIEQRTEAWYEHYSHVLTASEFSSLFGSMKARRALILSKAFPKREDRSNRLASPTKEMNAMGWGIRFEPIIKLILEYRYTCKIYEAGRITHTDNGMLAASPDGIIEESTLKEQIGRLVEIKCPYTRTIGGEIPYDYWVQMQIQMEVCDLDECEYIEAEILSPRINVETVDISGCDLKGNLYLLKQDVEEGEPFQYKYLYGEIDATECPSIPTGFRVIETIPWGLKKWHRKIVSRDRGWYTSTVVWQDAFWSDVELAKAGKPYSCYVTEKEEKCLISDE